MKSLKLTIKVIERESELFGLPVSDLFTVIFFVILWVMAPMFLDLIKLKCGLGYYLSCIVLTLMLFRLLKRFSKKGSKLLFSYISSKAIQPNRISPDFVHFEMRQEEKESKKEGEKTEEELSEITN